jgi:hypothetical protein
VQEPEPAPARERRLPERAPAQEPGSGWPRAVVRSTRASVPCPGCPGLETSSTDRPAWWRQRPRRCWARELCPARALALAHPPLPFEERRADCTVQLGAAPLGEPAAPSSERRLPAAAAPASGRAFAPASDQAFVLASGRTFVLASGRTFVPAFGLASGQAFVLASARTFVPAFGQPFAQASGRTSGQALPSRPSVQGSPSWAPVPMVMNQTRPPERLPPVCPRTGAARIADRRRIPTASAHRPQ